LELVERILAIVGVLSIVLLLTWIVLGNWIGRVDEKEQIAKYEKRRKHGG
jgi:hypothetical protein